MLARLVARAARSPKRVEQISRARSMSSGASVEEEIGASRATSTTRQRSRRAKTRDARANATRSSATDAMRRAIDAVKQRR
jgi:hypothetical protein